MLSMCIIIVAPPGTTPDVDNLVDATWENTDGSGWAMRTPHGLETVRSATQIDHVLGSFLACREQNPNQWAIWHSRLATQGRNTDENTHPYPVPRRPWVLAHNGILPLNDGPFVGQARSDSRILAEDIISEATWSELRSERSRLESWLQGDKVVILSEEKERGGSCLIFNEGNGHWNTDDGCWYSRKYLTIGSCVTCGERKARCQCSWRKYSSGASVHGTTWEEEIEEDDAYAEWWESQEGKEVEARDEYADALSALDRGDQDMKATASIVVGHAGPVTPSTTRIPWPLGSEGGWAD